MEPPSRRLTTPSETPIGILYQSDASILPPTKTSTRPSPTARAAAGRGGKARFAYAVRRQLTAPGVRAKPIQHAAHRGKRGVAAILGHQGLNGGQVEDAIDGGNGRERGGLLHGISPNVTRHGAL